MRTVVPAFGWLPYIAIAVGLLTGCAGPRMIDSEVQAYTANVPAVANASYRLERLPSQVSDASRDGLEALAHAALAQSGLVRDEVSPRYTIQLTGEVTQYVKDVTFPERRRWIWHDPFYRWNTGTVLVTEPARFRHSVRLVMRERITGEIVYETTAAHENSWADGKNVFPVLLQAALRDYPTPPTGPRTLNLPVPESATQK